MLIIIIIAILLIVIIAVLLIVIIAILLIVGPRPQSGVLEVGPLLRVHHLRPSEDHIDEGLSASPPERERERERERREKGKRERERETGLPLLPQHQALVQPEPGHRGQHVGARDGGRVMLVLLVCIKLLVLLLVLVLLLIYNSYYYY